LTGNENKAISDESILSRFPEIRVVLFDLGGTLWKPFGEKDKDEVLDFAVSRVAEEVRSATGRQVLQDNLKESLLSRIDGLRPNPQGLSVPCPDSLREIDLYRVVSESLSCQQVVLDSGLIQHAGDVFGHCLSRFCVVFPDTISVLSRLKRAGFTTGIVSNTSIPPHIMDRYLADTGIMELVNFRVLSSEVGWRKPHGKIYLEALGLAGVAAKEVLFTGDRLLEDVLGPRAMGMKSVLCRCRCLPCNFSPQQHPDAVIGGLEEII